MGKVFSFEEIKSGRVPTPQDFQLAQNIFEDISSVEVERGNFIGSFIFGSVAVGSQGPRSDFDSIVCLTDFNDERLVASREISLEIARQTRGSIPYEDHAQPKICLELGNHTFDRYFGVHLTGEDRIVCSPVDPGEIMTFDNVTPAKVILNEYLRSKLRRLVPAFEQPDVLDVTNGGLQRMLELPNAIGRKALQTLADVTGLPELQTRSVDKQQVGARALDLFSRIDAAEGYQSLCKANRDYSDLLDATIAGMVKKADYEGALRDLHSQIPGAIRWIASVQDGLMPIFDEYETLQK